VGTAIALLLDEITTYAFGHTDPETVGKANAYLKLFLMASRLLLSSTCGVASRARLLLTGTQKIFDFLLNETLPKQQTAGCQDANEATAGDQDTTQSVEAHPKL